MPEWVSELTEAQQAVLETAIHLPPTTDRSGRHHLSEAPSRRESKSSHV